MLAHSAVMLILYGMPATAVPIDRKDQAAAVEYARQLQANRIDSALPAERLDSWLAGVIADSSVEWFVSDCDLKSNSRILPEDRLLCVGAKAGEHGPIYLRFHLAVGNWARGVTGPPRVLPQSFVACNPLDTTIDSSRSLKRLADLPAVVGGLRDTCPSKK